MNLYRMAAAALAVLLLGGSPHAHAQSFFFVGPADGDFFDVNNWNDAADGTGSAPPVDSLPNSTTGAIAIDLVIDSTSVLAEGQVDFGVGSLTITNDGSLEITGSGNDIDFNSATTLVLSGSTLIADGDVVLEGSITIANSVVTATTDDIEIQDNAVIDISGSVITAGDNFFFDSFVGTVTSSEFSSADRLGIRAPGGVDADVVVFDTNISIQAGAGDTDNIFTDNLDSGGSLTLLGASTLLSDTVEEEVDLIIGGTSSATLGGNGVEILDNGSTATLTTFGASLIVNEITDDPRAFIINGRTGLSYADDSTRWNVTDWNGLDAVTLQIVPEPSTAAVLGVAGVASMLRRRKRG
ncbi:MAG: PEP-CTERM sorting domain-containing protein [Planctomycetota bacterium]